MFLAACLFLAVAIFSLWIRKAFWIWGLLLTFSLVFAQLSKKLSSYGLIPIFLSLFLFWLLSKNFTGLFRFALFTLALFFSAILCSCLAPQVPPCFSFFNVTINYSKTLLTLPLLGFCIPILSYQNIRSFFSSRSFVICILGAVCITLIAHFFFESSFSTTSPTTFFISLILYSLSSIIPEEALLRGFVQKELLPWAGKGWIAHAAVCGISAGLFSLFHLTWISSLPFFVLLFLVGYIYGILYQATKLIEVPILCRFLTNAACFFLFQNQGHL